MVLQRLENCEQFFLKKMLESLSLIAENKKVVTIEKRGRQVLLLLFYPFESFEDFFSGSQKL